MARIQQAAFNYTVSTAGLNGGGWLKCDYHETPFNLSALVSLDTGASLTLALAYILDDWSTGMAHYVSLSQTTTTITVTDSGPPLGIGFGPNLGHGLAVGDAVEIDGIPGAQNLFTVATVTSATVYTLTSTVSQTVAQSNFMVRTGKTLLAGSTGDKIIGSTGATITVRTALAINAPIFALQLQATTVTTPGVARLVTMQAGVSS
jgi:hypothetical protein